MMIMESWEVRWFGFGALPLPLQQWSEENSLTTQPVRTDYYLMHNAGKSMGIKWREGNLQVKELIEQVQENPQMERYKKWSFGLKENGLLQRIAEQPEWIAITKKRELLKWKVENGKLSSTEPGRETKNGVELEISAVICNGQLWWTVAYEATGSRENLEVVLNTIKIPLSGKPVCIGYAEWLDKNFQNER